MPVVINDTLPTGRSVILLATVMCFMDVFMIALLYHA